MIEDFRYILEKKISVSNQARLMKKGSDIEIQALLLVYILNWSKNWDRVRVLGTSK